MVTIKKNESNNLEILCPPLGYDCVCVHIQVRRLRQIILQMTINCLFIEMKVTLTQ